jgi:hypothetical protein
MSLSPREQIDLANQLAKSFARRVLFVRVCSGACAGSALYWMSSAGWFAAIVTAVVAFLLGKIVASIVAGFIWDI